MDDEDKIKQDAADFVRQIHDRMKKEPDRWRKLCDCVKVKPLARVWFQNPPEEFIAFIFCFFCGLGSLYEVHRFLAEKPPKPQQPG